MIDCIVVGAGGFIGAVCRYLIGMIPLKDGCTFPIKTLMINIAGSFLIGIVAALAMKTEFLDSRIVLFLKVGICGRDKRTMSRRGYDVKPVTRRLKCSVKAVLKK